MATITTRAICASFAAVLAGCTQDAPDHGAVMAQCQLESGGGSEDFESDNVEVCMRARGYVRERGDACGGVSRDLVWNIQKETRASLWARVRAWEESPEFKAAVDELIKKGEYPDVAKFFARTQMDKRSPEPKPEYETVVRCYKPVK